MLKSQATEFQLFGLSSFLDVSRRDLSACHLVHTLFPLRIRGLMLQHILVANSLPSGKALSLDESDSRAHCWGFDVCSIVAPRPFPFAMITVFPRHCNRSAL